MSWPAAANDPKCPCACSVPLLAVQYRSLSGDSGDVAGASFDDVEWGENGHVNEDSEVVSTSAAFQYSMKSRSYPDPEEGTAPVEQVRCQYRLSYDGTDFAGLEFRLRRRDVVETKVDVDGFTIPSYTVAGVTELTTTAAAGEVEVELAELAAPPYPPDPGPSGNGQGITKRSLLGPPSLNIAFLQKRAAVSLVRRGFPAYDGSGAFYKVETASGSFAGCPAQSLPAKTYSGARTLSLNGINPAGTLTDTLSADAAASGHASDPFPDGPPKAPDGRVDSATVRQITREIPCGGDTHTDALTLTLSTAYPASALRSAVDDAVAAQLATASEAEIGALRVERVLSADGTHYRRADLTWRAGAYGFYVFADGDLTLPGSYRKRIIDAATGTVTTTTETLSITASRIVPDDLHAGSYGGYTASATLAADDGKEVILDQLEAEDVPAIETQLVLEPAEA